jgi:CRISPR/Cas system-associated endoribonuclease Cas2
MTEMYDVIEQNNEEYITEEDFVKRMQHLIFEKMANAQEIKDLKKVAKESGIPKEEIKALSKATELYVKNAMLEQKQGMEGVEEAYVKHFGEIE